jgi:hypothetical protein
MTTGPFDDTVRRILGGDAGAAEWVKAHAAGIGTTTLVVVAALLEHDPTRFDSALLSATTRRERQLIEIARAHLEGRAELVDAFSREHLVDYPDDMTVAWIASGAVVPSPRGGTD